MARPSRSSKTSLREWRIQPGYQTPDDRAQHLPEWIHRLQFWHSPAIRALNTSQNTYQPLGLTGATVEAQISFHIWIARNCVRIQSSLQHQREHTIDQGRLKYERAKRARGTCGSPEALP